MPEDARLALLLSIADDELILGHRHSEWTGWAPHIEEDLAFSSIAQDEMAHARLLYRLAGESGLADGDEDALALGRPPHEYLNAWLCERPNRDWAYTLARQFLYDGADEIRLESLARTGWAELAEVIRVMQLEEKYHLDHARQWFSKLAGGPAEARQRFADGLSATIGEAMALFEPLPGEDRLIADGVLPQSNEDLLGEWLRRLGEELEAVSLDFVLTRHGGGGEMVPTSSGDMPAGSEEFTVPGLARRDGQWVHEGGFLGAGGRRGRHSEDFMPLWEEMTNLYRSNPGARW